MPEPCSYDYALIRVMPSVERGEQLNVGVILFARTRRFLDVRIELDEERLAAFAPGADGAAIRAHLAAFERICRGEDDAGPIGRLDQSGRFHWLVAPRSTIIQTSAVHPGRCTDPALELDRLFERSVRTTPGPDAA